MLVMGVVQPSVGCPLCSALECLDGRQVQHRTTKLPFKTIPAGLDSGITKNSQLSLSDI